MKQRTLPIISFIIFIIIFISCEKKTRMAEIKLLILTPENFYDFPVVLTGKIFNVGPGGLWFVLEDKTGYIQVTTENIPENISCIQKGKNVSIVGKLMLFKSHKYFSFSSLLRCDN